MTDLVLRAPDGQLHLTGTLELKADGGTVKVDNDDVLVELPTAEDPHATGTPPVVLPPPPGSPIDPGGSVWVIASLNTGVTVHGRAVVTQGMVLQGEGPDGPTWPGMVLPSQTNTTVTVDRLPMNVEGDQAVVFASGAVADLTSSGQ